MIVGSRGRVELQEDIIFRQTSSQQFSAISKDESSYWFNRLVGIAESSDFCSVCLSVYDEGVHRFDPDNSSIEQQRCSYDEKSFAVTKFEFQRLVDYLVDWIVLWLLFHLDRRFVC